MVVAELGEEAEGTPELVDTCVEAWLAGTEGPAVANDKCYLVSTDGMPSVSSPDVVKICDGLQICKRIPIGVLDDWRGRWMITRNFRRRFWVSCTKTWGSQDCRHGRISRTTGSLSISTASLWGCGPLTISSLKAE